MKRIFTLYLFILFCLILQAQEELYERVYVHTDKTCYLAGEEVWLKFYTIDTHFRPSSFSKVGYIGISNTERPKAQLKLALDNGSGSGKVKIPTDAPSGIYELTGYTRYMRNEGEKVFFRKSIAVINTFRVSDSDRTSGFCRDISERETGYHRKYSYKNFPVELQHTPTRRIDH